MPMAMVTVFQKSPPLALDYVRQSVSLSVTALEIYLP